MSIVRFLAVVESLIESDITPSLLSIAKKLVEDCDICQIGLWDTRARCVLTSTADRESGGGGGS